MQLSKTSQAFLDRYEAVRGALAGADVPWLAKIRDDAAATFGATGFPGPKTEEWKYTSLKALDELGMPGGGADAGTASPVLPDKLGAGPRLVFVDGRFRDDLSDGAGDHDGLRVMSFADALAADPETIEPRLADQGERSPLLALNGAFQDFGYVVLVAAGQDAGAPVEILFWDSAGEATTVRQPRNLIATGANGRVCIIERHLGAGASRQFFNGATLITADEGAQVQHYRMQAQGAGSVHVNTVRARVDANARYDSFVLARGARLARDEVQAGLMADGAACRLDGVYLGRGEQINDTTTVVKMAAPHTECRETYRGALDDTSRGVFQGHIRVERGASGADGQMSNKTLLLSEKAEIDTKPQLEIFHDDVKCGHGATAGEIDKEALFYLRSRGLPEDRARALLVEGFLGEVIDGIGLDEAAVPIRDMLGDWLATNAAEALAA
jgi:Fe-S cluster assembly protein SufD